MAANMPLQVLFVATRVLVAARVHLEEVILLHVELLHHLEAHVAAEHLVDLARVRKTVS
jgi:hypothetical protein